MAVVSLMVVTLLLLQVFVVVAAQLRVGDAARTAVRALARGDAEATVQTRVARVAPGAVMATSRDGHDVVVSVALRVRLPLIPGPGVTCRASARAASELVDGDVPGDRDWAP